MLLPTRQLSFSRVGHPSPQGTPLFHHGHHQSTSNTPSLCILLVVEVRGGAGTPPLLTGYVPHSPLQAMFPPTFPQSLLFPLTLSPELQPVPPDSMLSLNSLFAGYVLEGWGPSLSMRLLEVLF